MQSLLFSFIGIFGLFSCSEQTANSSVNNNTNQNMTNSTSTGTTDTATLANGCFWCTEAIFEQLDGVISATSG